MSDNYSRLKKWAKDAASGKTSKIPYIDITDLINEVENLRATIAATEAAKPAQEEDSQIRWCADGQIFGRPTATDALEYAEQRLRDPEEMICCKSDMRLDAMPNIRELLSVAKATGAAGELSDEEIEEAFKAAQGRWNGSLWEIEDADLHPFVRTILAARQPAPVLSDEEILMMASQHGVESREFSGECVISFVRAALSAATNRSQP